jgi:hypothetical protein
MTAATPAVLVPRDVYAALLKHLLPSTQRNEEAAFLFVRPDDQMPAVFACIDWVPVTSDGFAVQLPYHFELTDETRAEVIKRAHDLRASVVEVHSHLSLWKPQFSPSDWSGFQEIVPHLWWRLKARPYIAIVVNREGFDGLVWLSGDASTPIRLERIDVEGHVLEPSRLSPITENGYDWSSF